MQANELRKGNYFNIIDRTKELHLPIDFTQEVLSIGLFKVEFVNAGKNPALQEKLFEVNIFDMSPIRLTEDWLKIFSLNEPIGIHNSKFSGLVSVGVLHDKCVFFIGNMEITFVDYVHELQNIVYDLCNIELTQK